MACSALLIMGPWRASGQNRVNQQNQNRIQRIPRINSPNAQNQAFRSATDLYSNASRQQNQPGRLNLNQSSSANQNRLGRTTNRNQRPSLRNRTQPGGQIGAAAAPNVPARARPQAKSNVRRVQRAQQASTQPDKFALPAFSISPLIETDTVYFSPPDLSARTGRRFATPLFFYNVSESPIDRFDLWIRYDPELLDPVWIDFTAIKPLLDGDIQPQVWRERGFIRLEGKFASPVTRLIQPLATFNWQAGETPTVTEVVIEAPPGEEFGIFEGSINRLQLSQVGNRGVVPLQVRIISGEEADEYFRFVGPGEDPLAPAIRRNRGVHLTLVAARDRVLPGEVSTVDIVVVNPDLVPFDQLRVRLRFDPESVQILDADEENYITQGINIYDGAFHDTMPFEVHLKNEVDPRLGVIDYVVGSSVGVRPYPSRPVARIVYRMKREAGSAFFWFEGVDPLSGALLSDVLARGRSVLGSDSDRPTEGLHNVVIRVAPL